MLKLPGLCPEAIRFFGKNASTATDSGQRATSRRREGAKERRERRLRAEARIRLQLCRDAVRIASHRRAHTDAPVIKYVAPAPAFTCTAPSPGIGYVTLAPAVTHATPSPVIEYVAPASVIEYITSAPALTCLAPCEQLSLETMATVNTDVSCDTTGFVNPQIFYHSCGNLSFTGRRITSSLGRVHCARPSGTSRCRRDEPDISGNPNTGRVCCSDV